MANERSCDLQVLPSVTLKISGATHCECFHWNVSFGISSADDCRNKVVRCAGLEDKIFTVTETVLKSNPSGEIMIFATRIQESPSM